MKEKIEQFLEEWSKVAPLVRASAAYNVRSAAVSMAVGVAREVDDPNNHMLHRRRRVHKQFNRAYECLAGLCADLTNAADEEARARGIDMDTKAEPEVFVVWKNDAMLGPYATEERAEQEAFAIVEAEGGFSRISRFRWHQPDGPVSRLQVERRVVL